MNGSEVRMVSSQVSSGELSVSAAAAEIWTNVECGVGGVIRVGAGVEMDGIVVAVAGAAAAIEVVKESPVSSSTPSPT